MINNDKNILKSQLFKWSSTPECDIINRKHHTLNSDFTWQD